MNKPLLQLPANEAVRFTPFAMAAPEDRQGAFKEQLGAVVKRKWIIFAVAALCAIAMTVYAFRIPPTFRSTAVILIEPAKPHALTADEVSLGGAAERGNYLTQVEILRSHEVALDAARAMKLWEAPGFDPRGAKPGWAERLGLSEGYSGDKHEWSEAELADAAADALQNSVTIEPVRLSSLVRVSFDAKDRELAAKGANGLVQAYVDVDRKARSNGTQTAVSWLQTQMQSMQEKLNASEQALQTYRDQNGLISVSGSSQTIASQQVNEMNSRQADARAKRFELESAYQQAQQVGNGDYSSIPAVASNPGVVTAKQAEETAEADVAALSERYGPYHTSLIEAKIRLKAAHDSVLRQSRAAARALNREYEAALSTERSFSNSVSSARASVQNVNRQEFRLAELEREVQANKQLYDILVTRFKEATVGNEMQGAAARVVDAAVATRIPVKPQKGQMVTLAAIGGLVLASLAVLLFHRFDTSVKSVDDAELRLRLPVLASIPSLRGSDGARAGSYFLDQPRSHFAEAIRTIRTGVLLSMVDSKSKVLVVTSSLLSEGKTTVCANLAMAHAQTSRTLLIDADMRRPRLGRLLGLPSATKGLSNLVSGTADPSECMHFVARANLWVMPVGDRPPNPLELLLSQRFRDYLAAASQQFDIILIDAPPVELVSDALVLAPMASGVLYVVKAMETPYPVVREGMLKVQRTGANLVGLVLNHLASSGATAGHGLDRGPYELDGIYSYAPPILKPSPAEDAAVRDGS